MENGELKTDTSVLSNLWLSADIRDIAILKFNSGIREIVVSRNNDEAGVYAFTEFKKLP